MSNRACRFCNQENVHGPSCPLSSVEVDGNRIHVEIGDKNYCIYCGSTNFGPSCYWSPEDKPFRHMHKHGHDPEGRLCVWCGVDVKKVGINNSCFYSPTGRHEL